jgi:hypothetical protein
MRHDGDLQRDGWIFASEFSASRELSLPECVRLLRFAVRGEAGSSLLKALDHAVEHSEGDAPRAERWIAAIRQVRDEGLIAPAFAELGIYEVFHSGFTRAIYKHPEASALAHELDELQETHQAAASSFAHSMQPGEGWSAANARWHAKLNELRDAHLASLGEHELIRRITASPVVFAERLNATRAGLFADAGMTMAEGERTTLIPDHAGHRILDDMEYLFAHFPIADECCYLIKAGARNIGGQTLPDALDWARSKTRTPEHARRWMTGARWARESDVLSREASWAFMVDVYYTGCFDDALDDPVTSAIRAQQDAIREICGIEDERELDPEWYAPESWWALNRQWYERLDNHMIAEFRRIGEDDLADAVQAEGGDALEKRLQDVRERTFELGGTSQLRS